MATEKKRVTLYIDEPIHTEAIKVAEKLDMSLSAMTRLLYLLAASFGSLIDDVQRQHLEIQTLYPDGVPEEEAEAVTRRFVTRLYETGGRWVNYTGGLAAHAGVPGLKTGPVEMPTPQEMFKEAAEKMKGLEEISTMLEPDARTS